jgi:hypothetical protein
MAVESESVENRLRSAFRARLGSAGIEPSAELTAELDALAKKGAAEVLSAGAVDDEIRLKEAEANAARLIDALPRAKRKKKGRTGEGNLEAAEPAAVQIALRFTCPIWPFC